MKQYLLLGDFYTRIESLLTRKFIYKQKAYSEIKVGVLDQLNKFDYASVTREINNLRELLEELGRRLTENGEKNYFAYRFIRTHDYDHRTKEELKYLEIDQNELQRLNEEDKKNADMVRRQILYEIETIEEFLEELSDQNEKVNEQSELKGFVLRRSSWVNAWFDFLVEEGIILKKTKKENFKSMFDKKAVENGIHIKKGKLSMFCDFFRIIKNNYTGYFNEDDPFRKCWVRLQRMITVEGNPKSLNRKGGLGKLQPSVHYDRISATIKRRTQK